MTAAVREAAAEKESAMRSSETAGPVAARDAKALTTSALAVAALLALSGCGAASAVGTVLETTADVVGTGVDVVTAPVDLVVGDDDEDE